MLNESIEGQTAQLQYHLTGNPRDEILPQITGIKIELNSMHSTRGK